MAIYPVQATLLNNGSLLIESDPVFEQTFISTINNAGTIALTGTAGISGGGTTVLNNLAGPCLIFRATAIFHLPSILALC